MRTADRFNHYPGSVISREQFFRTVARRSFGRGVNHDAAGVYEERPQDDEECIQAILKQKKKIHIPMMETILNGDY